MVRDPADPDDKTVAGQQDLSCEESENEYARVIESLAGWIREDIGAVSNAFGVEYGKVYKDSLRRVRSQAAFIAQERSGR